MTEQREEFKVNGDDLVRKVKEVIKEGNVRMIIIKNEEGKEIVQIPLTLGVVGALVAPAVAALGAVAALVAKCTIVVVRDE